MKIASIQLETADGRSKEENIERALAMMDSCRGANLILLPELWNIGYFAFDRYHSDSEPIDGRTMTAVAAKARELGACVFSGSFVERRGDSYFNTSALFDRRGEKLAQYSKMHLLSYNSLEPELLSRGTEIAVVDTEFGMIGLSICYDLRFPELYRKMADAGAEIFLAIAGWPYPRLEAWNTFNVARAAENVCYLISCNSSGVQNGARYLGHSKIVDPWGTIVADSDFNERILRAEIDPAVVARIRNEFGALRDRVVY